MAAVMGSKSDDFEVVVYRIMACHGFPKGQTVRIPGAGIECLGGWTVAPHSLPAPAPKAAARPVSGRYRDRGQGTAIA